MVLQWSQTQLSCWGHHWEGELRILGQSMMSLYRDVGAKESFLPYGKHKGLAWLLFLCVSRGTVPFVPQKAGLLYHLPPCIVPTQLTGIDRGCLASPVLSDVWRCCAHALPACLGCQAVPDAITQLLLTQPSWLAVVSQAATEMTTIDDRALKSEMGHWLRALNPNWLLAYLFIHFWRKKRCYTESPTSDWLLQLLKK